MDHQHLPALPATHACATCHLSKSASDEFSRRQQRNIQLHRPATCKTCIAAVHAAAAQRAQQKLIEKQTQYDHIRTCVLGVECEACHGFNEHNGYGLDRD